MNVLSLFDGMSCGQIALKELGIVSEKYYASEIDKHAIKQTQLNFPDTIQLGDVTKWKEWKIYWGSINLLLAGSPCQGFSFAGKQLAFNDPRSKLFFVFVDILNHIKKFNPNVLFLLENVKMKKSHMRIISEYCGVFPVNINSNLVSAQNRDRWYWTNIRTKQIGLFGEIHTDIPQPEDKGIFLRDILESEVDEKYYINGPMLNWIQSEWRLAKKYTQINGEKALPALARQYANWGGDYVCVASQNNLLSTKNERIRRLSPVECSRLQTVPSWYRWKCSDTQIYKMLGNGWTVEVIKHILKYLPWK
ncbi:DNA (cytosine-5-)-methyltransferase [Bacteroides fragilis]|uniref:DNA (cytosine-5-)-methyltransferase n=1 Tax=Bacteroides fragilis TaxID=817 RepID=UPI001C703F88|nr:DNA (cytosine-5-)-methyltransferase [Bacteroides fragilis]MBW9276684.1 DNA cytosine methyltransferase [Bacteroides fragilis]